MATDAVPMSDQRHGPRRRRFAARPDTIEAELGLAFSGKSGVVVMSGRADASRKIELTYDSAATGLLSPPDTWSNA